MTALLLMTSVLLLVSGVSKVRVGARAGLGVPILALLELVSGVAGGGVAAVGLGETGAAPWLVPWGVFLVVASSIIFAVRLSAHRGKRAETEGGRLTMYVKHLSKPHDS